MLDFLNLREDAQIMIMILSAAGFFFAFLMARTSVWPAKCESTLSMITMCISLVLAAIACIPAFMLLITFKLKMFLTALLISAVVTGVFYLLFHTIFFQIRMTKYRRNPVVLEIADFCRHSNVAGIHCFTDGVIFYDRIVHGDLCKGRNETRNRDYKTTEAEVAAGSFQPAGMLQFQQSDAVVGHLRFADRGYPNLPDVAFFGKALAKRIPGFRAVSHQISTAYESHSIDKITRYITKVHDDSFVYSKEALKAWKREEAKKPKAPRTAPPAKGKHWD